MNTQDEVITHLRSRYADWMDAIARRDLEAIVGLYGTDAAYLPPGKPKAVGMDAIRRAWTEHLARPGFKARYTPTITVASGLDMAYDVGAYVVEFERDGVPQAFAGKYVVVWGKQDGRWVVMADIDNAG